MIAAARFLEALGPSLVSGVPCSSLRALLEEAARDDRYVGAANEGDAVAMACGAELAGFRGVVLLQNSGLGNAVSPLTSLVATCRLPVLLVVGWRARPDGPADEPQHALMGAITPALLELCGVPWAPFPADEPALEAALARIDALRAARSPLALLVAGSELGGGGGAGRMRAPAAKHPTVGALAQAPRPARREVLAAVQAQAGDAVVVATTGYTGRELYALADRPNQLYVVGAMGCASSLALGLCLARPRQRVIVLDGDGAALMRLGALATIGAAAPAGLVHVLLDNEAHESTGGQPTAAGSADLALVAAACGYARVQRIGTVGALVAALADARPGPTFLHVKTALGVPAGLPRPSIQPAEVAARLGAWLAARA